MRLVSLHATYNINICSSDKKLVFKQKIVITKINSNQSFVTGRMNEASVALERETTSNLFGAILSGLPS